MKKVLLPLVLITISSSSYCDVLGVSDTAMLAKAVEQLQLLKAQYDKLEETYRNAKSQLDTLNQIKNMNQGHFGFGNLGNSAADLKNRQWSPNSWEDALQNISGGNPARYQQLVKAYEKNHPTLSDAQFLKGSTSENLVHYKQQIAVNKTAQVQSTYAYNDINQHFKAVHDLSSQIEKAKNTKAAIDLNSRLLAEIAYIETQNLKLQSLISQQLSQAAFNEIEAETQMAKFNRLD